MSFEVVTIGNATLYRGAVADLFGVVPMVDLVLADPPYGVGESGRKNLTRGKPFGSASCGAKNTRATAIQPRDYGDYKWDEVPASFDELQGAISAGRHCIVWGGNHFGLPAASKWLVWDKLNSGDFADCELAWSNLPGAVRIFRHMWNGMLRDSERDTPRVHPTQKPIALMGWCIEQAPKPSSIGEPWMGSAPAGCAAAALGLSYWGIERDPRNFDIACRRIEEAQKQGALFPQEQAPIAEQLPLT